MTDAGRTEAFRASRGAGHAGRIGFGRPWARFQAKVKAMVRLIQPEEGMLLLFPAYVFHRTIPFEGADERISIAFDVLPMT